MRRRRRRECLTLGWRNANIWQYGCRFSEFSPPFSGAADRCGACRYAHRHDRRRPPGREKYACPPSGQERFPLSHVREPRHPCRGIGKFSDDTDALPITRGAYGIVHAATTRAERNERIRPQLRRRTFFAGSQFSNTERNTRELGAISDLVGAQRLLRLCAARSASLIANTMGSKSISYSNAPTVRSPLLR